MSAQLKRCIRCDQPQARTQFSRSIKSNDGLQSWCKRCNRAYRKAHRAPVVSGRNHPWRHA